MKGETMSTLTKQEWAELKTKIDSFETAYLNCDGYAVLARIRKIKMRLIVTVYVNNEIKGEWFSSGLVGNSDELPDIAKRFYPLKKTRVSAEKQKNNIRMYGKKFCETRKINAGYRYVDNYFSTTSAFITHIKKNNESIQIINRDQYDDLVVKNTAVVDRNKTTQA